MSVAIQTKEVSVAEIVSFRAARAARIKELSQRFAENMVALGRELRQARDSFPRGPKNSRPGWQEWLADETEFSENWANTLINIAEKFGPLLSGGQKLGSLKVLTYLTRGNVPEAGRREVVDRIKKGESIGLERAKEIVRPHLPTRAQAIKEARDTGTLISARDGKMYSGASEDEMAAYSDRRSAVFGIERAVQAIAECEFTPQQWIEIAEDHWIHEFCLGNIDIAIKWLTKVRPLLERRQKVVSQ